MLDDFYEICKFIVCLCGTAILVLLTITLITLIAVLLLRQQGGKLTFNHNGLHFEAYEGGLIVKKDGELQLQVFDVFRKGIPSKEKIIKFYNALLEMSGESE